MNALKRVVFWQSGAWLLACVGGFLLAGRAGGLSALFGGASCALPSFIVVGLLWLTRRQAASPAGIFLYEFLKVSMTTCGLLLTALFYSELNWPVFIMTAGLVLLSHIFALASRH